MYDVIVVGARSAGASTAMLLARRGMNVLAVDRARFPSDTLSTPSSASSGSGPPAPVGTPRRGSGCISDLDMRSPYFHQRQPDDGIHRNAHYGVTERRNDIEAHYLGTLDRCGDLGERIRCGQRVERIRTTPDLPNHVRASYGPGWALVGDAGLVMDPVSAQGIGNAFLQAEWLAAALTTGLGGATPLAACLADYKRRRDAAMLRMYDFTLRLASLTPDPRMQLLLDSLVGRQTEIDRLLGVFAGIIPIPTYFSTRNFVRLLGVRRAARAVLAARTRPRPGSAGNGVVHATDELRQRDGIVRISS